MGRLVLYEFPPNPPVRAVRLCLEELGLQVESKFVNMIAREDRLPDYLKMNPQHSVPTLIDGDLIICDSHAINAYLVTRYGRSDALYPKDPGVRSQVDQRLHFDSGILFPAVKNIGNKLFSIHGKVTEEDKARVSEALGLVDKFLDGKKFITGATFNIADFSVYTSGSALETYTPELFEPLPNLTKYLELCKSSFKGIRKDDDAAEAFAGLLLKALGRPEVVL